MNAETKTRGVPLPRLVELLLKLSEDHEAAVSDLVEAVREKRFDDALQLTECFPRIEGGSVPTRSQVKRQGKRKPEARSSEPAPVMTSPSKIAMEVSGELS